MEIVRWAFVGLMFASLTACDVGTEPAAKRASLTQKKFMRGAERLAECQAETCRTLNLQSASLPDFSVLNELTHVTSLDLVFNGFDDLRDISEMRQLTALRLEGVDVRDVSALASFENLETLTVRSGSAGDIRPILPRLPKLRFVGMNVPTGGDINFLRRLPKLRGLTIWANDLVSLTPLRGHANLDSLWIRGHLPEDRTTLLKMPALKKLTVFDVEISDDDDGVMTALKAKGVQLVPISTAIIY